MSHTVPAETLQPGDVLVSVGESETVLSVIYLPTGVEVITTATVENHQMPYWVERNVPIEIEGDY